MATRLFVGNLSFAATEDGLRAAFAEDGRKVVSVRIMLDRDTGRSRGFAFVDMDSQDDAHAAITALDGVDLEGRALRVSLATERPERSAGSRPPPRRDGPSGGPPPRRFDDAPRGRGREEVRRGERGPERSRDEVRRSKRPHIEDDDDDDDWS